LTPNQIATLLSKFIKYESCPSENHDLLPESYQPHPRLFLSPRLFPGSEAEISFPYPEVQQGEHLYVAFLAGAQTIFARITELEVENDNGNISASHPSENNRSGNVSFEGGRKGNKHYDDDNYKGEYNGDGNKGYDDNNNRNGENYSGKGGSGRMEENNRNIGNDRGSNNEKEYKDEKNRKEENKPDEDKTRDDDSFRNKNNRNAVANLASSRFLNNNSNNHRRYFVEIPRDLAAKGTVFVIVVKAHDNIGEVRLDEQSTVAGPAIANFAFDAWNQPIGW
jgi:hypothetical protein